MTEKNKEKLPLNYMVDEFMNQQLLTLNKEKKKEVKNGKNSSKKRS